MSGSFLVKDNWGKKSSRTILNAYKFHCVFKSEYMHIKIPSDKKLGYTMTLRQTSFTNQITFALCFSDMKNPIQRLILKKDS